MNRSRGIAGAPSAVRKVVDGPDELREVGATPEVEPPAGPALGADVAESRLRRQVVPVGVHVLAEERDLPEALRRDAPGLVDDVVERAAALRAATERHDAVGAGLVAAVDDRQPRAHAGVALDRPAGHGVRSRAGERIGHADRRPTDDRGGADGAHRRRADRGHAHPRLHEANRPLRRGEPKPIDELGLLVGPKEEVNGRESLVEPIEVHLAHRAAGHHHPHRRVGRLELVELALAPDDLGLGRLADRAGVDDDEVRLVHRGRLGAAGGEQPPGHLLRVAPVHLAAERPDVEARQGARFGPEFLDRRVDAKGLARGTRRRWRDLEHRERATRFTRDRHEGRILAPAHDTFGRASLANDGVL